MGLSRFAVSFKTQVKTAILSASFPLFTENANKFKHFSSSFSSSAKIRDDKSVSTFLTETLGLSKSELSTVRKRDPNLFRDTEQPLIRLREAFQLFKEYGFTEDQIRRLSVRCPQILSHRANETLRPKLQIIRNSLPLPRDALAHIISQEPRILSVGDIETTIAYFMSLFREHMHLSRAVRLQPRMLAYSVVTAEKQIRFLRDSGISEECIFRAICSAPGILCRTVEATRFHIPYLRGFGLSDTSKTFGTVLGRLMTCKFDTIVEKLKMIETLGLRDEEIKLMVRRQPYILLLSFGKIKRIAHFLIGKGIPHDIFVKYPGIFMVSLEKRIRPRHVAFRFLIDTPSSNKVGSILPFLLLPEKKFLEKYVNCHPHRPKLLQILRLHKHASPKKGNL